MTHRFSYGLTCLCCAHFQGAGKCEAFPVGIPFAILDGRHDHRTTHYPMDGGLLWESTLRPAGGEQWQERPQEATTA